MCSNKGWLCQVVCLALPVFLLYGTPSCLGVKLQISTLNPGEPLRITCDQAPFWGVTLVGLDLWHMTTQGTTLHVASLAGGRVTVHEEGLDPKAVYGIQLQLVNMLTLDLSHARPDQLGGYFCTVRYRTKDSGDDIVAVGGYINFFPTLD